MSLSKLRDFDYQLIIWTLMCEFQVLSENRDSSSRWLRTVPGRKPTTTFCWSKTRGMDILCTVEKTQMILAKQFLISLSASTSSEIGNPIPCSKQLQPLKKIWTETKQFQRSDIIWRSSLIYNYSHESFNQNRKLGYFHPIWSIAPSLCAMFVYIC